ncbi:hypothetical protein D3C86_1386340 [compost metagenome]
MRRRSVAGKYVELIDDRLADIAMQIIARGNDHIRSHHGAGAGNPVTFRIIHTLDIHRSMHGEIKPVERQRGLQTLEEFPLERVIGRARHRAARHRPRMQKRQYVHPALTEEIEILGLQQFDAAKDTKIFLPHQHRRIGAAFGMNSTNGNTHVCFPSINRAQGDDGGKTQPVLLRFWCPRRLGNGRQPRENQMVEIGTVEEVF